MGVVPLVINNQDAPLFFHRRPPILKLRAPAFLRPPPIAKYPGKDG
jgi:hypothetical protein